MGIARFRTNDGSVRYGYASGSSILDFGMQSLRDLLTNLPDALASGEQIYDRSEVTLLSPVDPGTVVRFDGCYEHNIADDHDPHLGEFIAGEAPSIWVTPNSSLCADDCEVSIPTILDDVRPGVELGLVIGRHAENLSLQEAADCIIGYTVCRTLSGYDQHPGLYGYRMFAGSLGVGPTIVPEVELPVALGVRQNDETVDQSSTAHLRFSLGDLVRYASHIFTLNPGDLLVTGNPLQATDSVNPGDTVTAWIESVGQQTAALSAEGENR